MGSTSFTAGYRRNASNAGNHLNNTNTWIWTDKPKEGWLGVTYTRWIANLIDCDIWYNSRKDYKWTYGLTNPGTNRSYWPIDFRNVARHETGHAIGFDHEDRTLASLNAISTHGCGVPHATNTGMLPHATDKAGGRFLYKGSGTTTNLMATRWREPTSSSSGARSLWTSGTWAAGAKKKVQFWLENQTNGTITGGSKGVRVGIYLSANTTISTSDTRVAEYYFTGNWAASASQYYNLDATAPSNFTPGKYYVGVIFDNTSIVAEKWETDNACLVGEVSITNVARTATVRSKNPSSGVAITVSRTDRNSLKNGTTSFTRSYWNGQSTVLTAPTTKGKNPFYRWTLNGSPKTSGVRTLTLPNTANATAVAEYRQHITGAFYTYGKGCPGYQNKIPAHTGSGTPENGKTIGWSVSARPSSRGAICVGSSSQSLHLAVIGNSGCYWLVKSWMELPISTNSKGGATLNIKMPKSSAVIGTNLYSQYAIIDASVKTPLPLAWSNGLRTYIGGTK